MLKIGVVMTEQSESRDSWSSEYLGAVWLSWPIRQVLRGEGGQDLTAFVGHRPSHAAVANPEPERAAEARPKRRTNEG